MEREYTIGGVLVLITILTIALIVYFTVPDFNEAINQIADEVFGISIKAFEEYQKESNEKIAEGFFDSIIACLKNADKPCTCELSTRYLPEGYKIETQHTEEEKKSYLILLDPDRIPLEKELLEEITFCRLKKLKEKEDLASLWIESDDKEIKINGKYVLDITPEIYRFDKNHFCFITRIARSEAKLLRKFPDCVSGKVKSEEKMINFFNNFIKEYKICRQNNKEKCKCSIINFEKLLDGYSITASQKRNTTEFNLKYDEREIAKQTILKNYFGINGETGLTKEPFTFESGEYYIFKKYSLSIHLYNKKTTIGKFFGISSIAKEPFCSVSYDVEEPGCEQKLDTDFNKYAELIKTKEYDGKTYEQYIKEGVENLKGTKAILNHDLKLLTAGVMITESKGENLISPTGCKGLMQFCAPTAQGFAADKCDASNCLLCPKSGCTTNTDNRERPNIAIPAGVKYINQQIRIFDKYRYKEIFGLAAYNGGAAIILNAIKATKEQDPTWQEVKKEINTGLLKEYSPYNNKKYYPTTDSLKQKVQEIKCYPYLVENYKRGFEGSLFV